MSRFLEAILFENGKMPLIAEHEERFARTQHAKFGRIVFPSVEKIIQESELPEENDIRYKCRVIYDSADYFICFSKYEKRIIDTLIAKEDNEIEYDFKYADRDRLNNLTKDLSKNEEVLIVKNGFITDTSYTNVALWNGSEWLTPKQPLLKGTRRNFLLKQNIIREENIAIQQLKDFSSIKLFNALLDWEDAYRLDCSKIIV